VDGVGTPLLRNEQFELWRARPDIPGREDCSQDVVETVTRIEGELD
jgi:hypothetical protein